jgi:integrase/recombinase XerD
MKTPVNLMLWLLPHKANTSGQAPVYCRVTVRGRRSELSTGVRVAPKDWDDAAKRVLGKSDATKRANSYLLQLQNELEDLIADLNRQGKPITAQGLTKLYKKGNTPTLNLLALFKEFLVERESLVGVEIAPKTVAANQTKYNRLEDFLTTQRSTDLLPEEMTHNLADKLLHWLLKERGFKRGSANKVLQTVFQVLRWGVRREYIDRNPLELYKFKSQAKGKIKYLTVGELEALSCLEIADTGLGIARDCFVLQCWTGLAFADLAALNVQRDADYHRDKAGNLRRVLRITRAKSTMQKGYECVIPLLPEAERILAHYGDALPVPTNQYYNRQLKELGALAGIEADKMTTHVGRKTAGTLLLNLGIPLPVVSKFLGHANVLITQKLYAELLDTTVIDAFAMLQGLAGELPPPAPRPQADCKPVPMRPARRAVVVPPHQVDSQPGGYMVPLWSTTTLRKEVASA